MKVTQAATAGDADGAHTAASADGQARADSALDAAPPDRAAGARAGGTGRAEDRVIPGDRAQALLEDLPAWGDLVTIVLHGGCVFEYKGPFPRGSVARGFYNLQGTRPGFEGHLKLDAIDHIAFQDRAHAGRIAHALTFNDRAGGNLFKVFLGRDDDGAIWPEQIARYEALRSGAVSRSDSDGTNAMDSHTGGQHA